MKIDEARRSFFVEDEGAQDGFARKSWRGAVLDRDKYEWHAMPKLLWEALREASEDSCWWICGYAGSEMPQPDPVSFSFDWDSFLYIPGWSVQGAVEWVAYNGSQTIAVLAEHDVTIVGATQTVADELDRVLQDSGTNLRQLTLADFPEPGRLEDFIKSVTK
ncbi:MAG TPA: hypothetical protein VM621_01610 [Luteibacter sp.]|uniref:hypothetical protein n=1 Tax=Luteibacter sp. TaxID=1886636 RepID=UPI002BE9B490|nr:hypothetical protein [Luteibacter sp.]HVI53730.1 hypothetical protein [Luteibacter sp.]